MKKILLSLALLSMISGGVATMAMNKESIKTTTLNVKASSDWNKVLDEFEKYVDQYIKTLKKAKSGDVSAMTEYVELAEKAQKLSEKIENAEDEMTAAQTQRYLKILKKMTAAMSDL